MLENLRQLMKDDDQEVTESAVVHECRRCGTKVAGDVQECPLCGSDAIAHIEIA